MEFGFKNAIICTISFLKSLKKSFQDTFQNQGPLEVININVYEFFVISQTEEKRITLLF